MATLTGIPPAILRGIAPLRTTPADDASSVFRTHITVTAIQRRPDGSQYLAVTTGNVGLRAWLPPGSPPVEHGKAYTIEQHKGAHPLFDPFTAIYPKDAPQSERRKTMMSQLIPVTADAAITMTSREIADLVQARHDSVKRTIERLAEKGVIQLPPMVEVEQNQSLSPNNKTRVHVFAGEKGKRDSIVVVAQLSPEFTARLVDRWQELEAMHAKPAIPQTLPDALRLAADLAEQKAQEAQKRIAAETALAEAAPKAQALERIAQAQGSLCITDAAKALQVTPQTLFRLLQAEQWIYRRPGGAGWLGYQNRIQSGLLEHKVTTVTRDDGSDKVVEQCRITPKGLARLASSLKPITPRPPIQ